ncbi:hypothetical protein LGM15_20970 [Klebsiella pneumoniae]|uniref:hypothetical protein n=1 Tax=Klebsiella pneumoniae TaxID=573 RepID=UPI001CFDF14B|nr:hypothetical protein [Klebsiella pneumoniae]UDD11581.1 hypothetical protein LGM15_20970 [Klebsiella pneumoniae]
MSKTETNGTEDNDVTGVGTFDQIHTELRKVHNIRTPSGAVVKMDGDDKIWWAYFYTFSLTKRIYGHSRFCNTDFDDKLACLNLSGV